MPVCMLPVGYRSVTCIDANLRCLCIQDRLKQGTIPVSAVMMCPDAGNTPQLRGVSVVLHSLFEDYLLFAYFLASIATAITIRAPLTTFCQ